MKKVLFAGALAACMALSSAAFATDNDTAFTGKIAGTYNKTAGTVSVTAPSTTDLPVTDQYTLVILKGGTITTIDDTIIKYIDQDSKSATKLFQDMGLLDGLTAGETYTIRMGSDASDRYIENTFTVTAGQGGEITLDFVWGDVNEDGACTQTDAMDILTCSAGGASIVGNSTHELNKLAKKSDGTNSTHVWGDVNEDGACTQTDAMDILTCSAGGASIVGNSTHELNKPVSIK